MKPDEKTCLNCAKQIDGRRTFCSDKCRKAYARNSDKSDSLSGQIPNSDTKKPQIGQLGQQTEVRASLTKADKTFFDRAMRDFKKPYYNFSEKIQEKKCDLCNVKFKTSLALNRYCSYEHYQESVNHRTKK